MARLDRARGPRARGADREPASDERRSRGMVDPSRSRAPRGVPRRASRAPRRRSAPARSTRSSSRSAGRRRSTCDPFDVYRALRMLNPSPYLFYLRDARGGTCSARRRRCSCGCRGPDVETRPIAGTAPRGATPDGGSRRWRSAARRPEGARRARDARRSRPATTSGACARSGTVQVPRYASVEKYSHVQHIVSEVAGALARRQHGARTRSPPAFPAGTLTGAPKIRAMELIDELEPAPARRLRRRRRLPRCRGATSTRRSRSARPSSKATDCRVQAGAGIVADSVPEKEYREAESKAAALFRAVELRACEWAGSGDGPTR